MFCWINGEFLKDTNLKISPFDYGYLYGINTFEIFRTYYGKVLFFQEHFNRLIETLTAFQVQMPYTILQLQQAIEELTKMDETDAIIHLNVSAGKDFFHRRPNRKPNVMILRSPLGKKRKGEVAVQWEQLSWPLKDSIGRFHGQKLLIPYERYENKIYFNDKDILIGGTYSTFFWAKNNTIYTPRIKEDDYCDITRKWVLITAKQLGIKVIEDIFTKKDLEDAYECFFTNSIEGIVPISKVNDKRFLGKEGPIYEVIYHAYLEEIFQLIQGDGRYVRKV